MSARAYLDHASTSVLRPEALEAMAPWMSAADPGRMHTEGRMARAALEDGRDRVAALFGTRGRQVVFTSGATEAINAAVHGALARFLASRPGVAPRVVGPAVEHSAVRDASSQRAAEVTWTGVGEDGRADLAALLDAVRPHVALVHCQWANHEVGAIQPVADVVAACRQRGVLVHVDAACAAGHAALAFDDLGADLMSVSSHKLGGPRGAGALLVRRGLRVPPMIVGGAQERDRRAGMEDVPALVGFGAACEALAARLDAEARAAQAHTDRLRDAAGALAGVSAFGPGNAGARLPHIVCLGIDGVEAEAVLLGLDQAGVAAHSGSACSSETLEPSPVLEAMGVDAERSLRLSVGWSTTTADVDRAAAALPAVIGRLRHLAGA